MKRLRRLQRCNPRRRELPSLTATKVQRADQGSNAAGVIGDVMTRSFTVQTGTAPADTARTWRDSRGLVTGATGFIGSHLVRRLAGPGAEVDAGSRQPAARQQQASGQRWHAADLGDPEATTELIRSTSPDVVFHLASAVTGRRDVRLVRPTLQSNLTSAVNLLTAVVGRQTRVVLAGSIEEPNEAEPVPPSP